MENEKNHFVYIHIRPDKNEIFYVGLGTKQINDHYCRARQKTGRNCIWHGIVSRNDDKFKYKIVFESNDYDEIKQKEIDLIKLYGRIDQKTGPLANQTDGGSGLLGRRKTKSEIKKIKKSLTGKKYPTRSIHLRVPIKQFDLEGNLLNEFESVTEAGSTIGISNGKISFAARTGAIIDWSYQIRYSGEVGNKIKRVKAPKNKVKSVCLFEPTTGKLCKIFDSQSDAGRYLESEASVVRECIKNRRVLKNYLVSYYKDRDKIEPLGEEYMYWNRPITVYNLDGSKHMEFPNSKEIERILKVNYWTVLKVCRRELRYSGKYQFRFSDKEIARLPSLKHAKGIRVPIYCFDINGKFLKEFQSQHAAARETGSPNRHISRVCLGELKSTGSKSGKRYIWRKSTDHEYGKDLPFKT